jgi:hypothetical protein
MGSTTPVALSTLASAGLALLALGAIWCFVYPKVQNQIGVEVGKWKVTGLPTGAILIVAGIGLLYLDSQDKPPAKPDIGEVTLTTADGQPSVDANVRCPFAVNLTGRISVTGGQGDIAYRFVRQHFNGPIEPTDIQSVHADGGASLPVHDSYTFNIPTGELYVEDHLEVLTPESINSEPVKMTVTCNAELPASPTTPPPEVPGDQQP